MLCPCSKATVFCEPQWPGRVLLFTAERESQRHTNLPHFVTGELGDPAPEALLSHSYNIMEIDGAGFFHAVLDIKNHFGRDVSNGGAYRRHRYAGEIADSAGAGQNENRPLFLGSRETV